MYFMRPEKGSTRWLGTTWQELRLTYTMVSSVRAHILMHLFIRCVLVFGRHVLIHFDLEAFRLTGLQAVWRLMVLHVWLDFGVLLNAFQAALLQFFLGFLLGSFVRGIPYQLEATMSKALSQ